MDTGLDRLLGELVASQRLVGWPDMVRLRQEALRLGETRGGSPLAAALVRTGALPAAQVDALLRTAQARWAAARAPAGADDGDRTAAPDMSWRQASSSGEALRARSTAGEPGDRTVAAPGGFGASPGGFGASPGGSGASPGGFGASPGGPGPSPGGFGASPGGFGASPGGFGASPGGFGASPGGPGPSPGSTAPGDRTHAAPASGPSVEERAEAVLAGGRFERQEDLGDERYRALDRRIGRPVLLCLGPPVAGPAGAATLERVGAFFREARLLAAVEHPAAPRVFDAGVEGGRAFVALERVEGARLADALRGRDAPPLPALLRAFLEVTGAVARAHEAGVIHGGVGPERVVLGARARVVVDGWAWAVAASSASPEVAAAAALPPPRASAAQGRRAPEVARGRVDARTDVFGLGLVLERMLHGRPAPRALRAIVRKALRPLPSQRYATARALQEDVRRFLDGRSVSAEPEGLVGAAARLGRRHPAAAAVIAVLAVALAALGAGTAREVARAQREVEVARGEAAAATEARTRSLADAERLRVDAARVEELARRLDGASTALGRATTAWAEGEDDRRVRARLDEALAHAERARALARDARAQARGAAQVAAITTVQAAAVRGQAAVRLARGDFLLRRARRTLPAAALGELHEAVAGERALPSEQRAEALLGVHLAARRLAVGGARAHAAMLELAELEGPLGDVARAYPLVVEAEAGGHRDEPEADRARHLAALEALAAGERRDLSLARELHGRYRRATYYNVEALRALLDATLHEPTDPFAYALFVRYFNRCDNLMPLWREGSGRNLTALLARSSRVDYPRGAPALAPGPVLDMVQYLQWCRRAVGSRPLVATVVAELEPLAAEHPEVAAPLARGRVLLARANLASGRAPGVDLDELALPSSLPPELLQPLRQQRDSLRGWAALRAGRVDDAARAFAAALDAPPPTRESSGLEYPDFSAYHDLVDALLDPHGRPDAQRALAERLGRHPRCPDDVIAAHARAVSLLGGDPRSDLQALSARGGRGAALPELTHLTAQLAEARGVVAAIPEHPFGHLVALQLWASVNALSQPSEPLAAEARDVLVARLRALGRADLARAFEAIDPAAELWVPRTWLPPEASVWRDP